MLLSENEVKKLAERVLAFSKADEAQVNITGGGSANTRFAVNAVTTSGYSESVNITIESRFGKRKGAASANELSDDALARMVSRSEEIARLAPEDAETQPFLGAQNYKNIENYSEKTALANPAWRAQVAASCIKPSREKGLISSGFVQNSGGFTALANSRGLFGYYRRSNCSYSTTVRTADGTGSGWAGKESDDADGLDGKGISERAIDKAILSQKPEALDPGQYAVILEPTAVSDIISFLFFAFGAREADEGRSFLAKKGGGVRLGEKFFHESIGIRIAPGSKLAPGAPFDGEGLPTEPLDLVKKGIVENLICNRAWAAKTNRKPTAAPTSIIVDGGTVSVEDMIKSTKRGILVTRFWYIRLFDPQTMLLTGLTRDGTFLIEDGAIKRPIKNFRFNESPIALLRNVEALSPTERVLRGGGADAAVPAIKAHSFTFSSLSDAV